METAEEMNDGEIIQRWIEDFREIQELETIESTLRELSIVMNSTEK